MSDNRARAWFAAFVLLVFCIGGVIGLRIGARRLLAPGNDGPRFGFFGGRGGPGRGGPLLGRGPIGPPPLPPDLVNRLSRELQLDAPQEDQVKKILEERRERFERIHREARERFDQEQRDLQAAIRGVLRADQQQKFDTFLDRRPPPPDRRPR
jgi:hypothetical protein